MPVNRLLPRAGKNWKSMLLKEAREALKQNASCGAFLIGCPAVAEMPID
ncbi:hypothetical protein [Cupriavidus taiwanensis]|nr:hypothetical protein [Cupriavidus taiwanensis]